MLTAQAHIRTTTPGRYLDRLCKHASGMQRMGLGMHQGEAGRPRVQHIEQTRTGAALTFSIGRCALHAGTETLTVRAEAATEHHLRQIQELITRDPERLGHREQLTVTWQQP